MKILTPGAVSGAIVYCPSCAGLFGSMTDLVVTATPSQVQSAGQRPFTSADIGKSLIITAGSGFTRYDPTAGNIQPGIPQLAPVIGTVSSGIATLYQQGTTALYSAGTAGSTGGTAKVGYCTLVQAEQGDLQNIVQSVVNGVVTGLKYAWTCPFCQQTNAGTVPLSTLQTLSGGKHPAVLAQDGLVITKTLAGVVYP